MSQIATIKLILRSICHTGLPECCLDWATHLARLKELLVYGCNTVTGQVQFALVYLEDINILSRDAEECILPVHVVLLLLHISNVTLNLRNGSPVRKRSTILCM